MEDSQVEIGQRRARLLCIERDLIKVSHLLCLCRHFHSGDLNEPHQARYTLVCVRDLFVLATGGSYRKHDSVAMYLKIGARSNNCRIPFFSRSRFPYRKKWEYLSSLLYTRFSFDDTFFLFLFSANTSTDC